MDLAADKSLTLLTQNNTVKAVSDIIACLNGHGYLVGGAVRDALWQGVVSDDLDFAVTDVSAEKVAKAIAEKLNGRYVLLDADYGIHRVVLFDPSEYDNAPDASVEPAKINQTKSVDVADALGNDINTDLARRDLTVNAMALNLESGELLDPFDGQADLSNQQIRMVSEFNLLDDPLRLLRVFRFAAVLNTTNIDAATLAVVKDNHSKVLNAAGERIAVEWLKLLDAKRCFAVLEIMGDAGILEALFPEFKPMRDIPPNGHHHLGLFEHTLELVNQAEQIFPTMPNQAKEWINQPFNGAVSRLGLIKFACLLHDIGKPDTMDQLVDEKTGKVRFTFYGHDKVSADLTKNIGKRLKLSKKNTEYLQKLCRWHLYPCHFGKESPRKSVMRFFRRIDEDVPDLMLLALADRHSTLGPEITADVLKNAHQNHLWLLSEYFAEKAVLRLPPLLTGQDVMQLLNIKPGPQVGKVLNQLKEAQQLGDVASAEAAKIWVADKFKPL